MLHELDNGDWEEAFKYANGFDREDVVEIHGFIEGENDGDPWRTYGKLRDGRYFYLEAWCDYTGWGCQEGGHSAVEDTRENIVRYGLTEEARRVFGFIEDNVGTINVRLPRENRVNMEENGFTKITKDRKEKKIKKEENVEKKRPNNSILSLGTLNED